eukprot:CAMPEP_0168527686 /NCGR_PEP_ID=MMETSP0405-20121227/12763_1 /TAXON_ID=498012 /ORGANISM="Trichosphaerium sp, Strain Am-I-7 wt" /LENGTH=504 /DNA_ID=CAMNT_0008550871 /DNA_START=1240 /DNA_END=2754 /DNA_ORIENTATION=+
MEFIQCFYSIEKLENRGVHAQAFDQIRFEKIFVNGQLCLEDTHYLYEMFKTILRNPEYCPIVYNRLFARRRPGSIADIGVTLSKENVLSEGPKAVLKIIDKADLWTLSKAWLELQLCIDHWWWLLNCKHAELKESDNSIRSVIELILYRIVYRPNSSVIFGWMLNKLVLAPTEILKATQRILDTSDLLQGKSQLKNRLKQLSIPLSFREPLTPPTPTDEPRPPDSNLPENLSIMVARAFLDIVLPVVTKIHPKDIELNKFIESLLARLEAFIKSDSIHKDHRITGQRDLVSILRQRDILCVYLRILLPSIRQMASKPTDISQDFPWRFMSSLMDLLTMPIVTNYNGGNQRDELITLLVDMLASFKQIVVTNDKIKRKIKEHFKQKKFGEGIQLRLEHVLPPLVVKERVSALHTYPTGIDPWIVLQGAKESPLFSAIGASQVKKRGQTFAERLFNSSQKKATPVQEKPLLERHGIKRSLENYNGRISGPQEKRYHKDNTNQTGYR